MAVIDQTDTEGRIIFMEGWDGAGRSRHEGIRLWPGWRGWHSASYCDHSPTWQAIQDDSRSNHIYWGGHSPPGGFLDPYGTDGGRNQRAMALQSPNFLNFGQHQAGLIYRTGSGVDSDVHAGFPDIVDCESLGPSDEGRPVYLGFAFKFPSKEYPTAATPVGQLSGTQGFLKVWMGDSSMNGWDALISEIDPPGGHLKVLTTCTASNGCRIDPGEPNQYYNGGKNWFAACSYTPCRTCSQFQERRVCLEIRSGSSQNITLYRTDQLDNDPDSEPVGVAWQDTADYPITHDKWYWGVWEHCAEQTTAGGRSRFYIGSATVPTVQEQGDCRDTKDSTIISNLAFAFRGPDAGLSASGAPFGAGAVSYPTPDNPVPGYSMSGTWDNGAGKYEWEPNQQIWIDDIVLMYNKRPAETYCVVLTASVAAEGQGNWVPINTGSSKGAVLEDLSSLFRRVPQTGSWIMTDTDGDEFAVTKFATLPYDTADINIYGVQTHAFPTTDTPSDFGVCKTKIAVGGTYTQRMTQSVCDTSYLSTMGPTPASGVPISTMGISEINPFTYIVSKVFYDGYDGIDLQGDNINKLSASVKLRS